MAAGQDEINETLYGCVERNDMKGIQAALDDGANATIISPAGRSAIGLAALTGKYAILLALLNSCNNDEYLHESKKIKIDRENNSFANTPEEMEGLQWDEEIIPLCSMPPPDDDEWSKLYKYYARMIEYIGEIVTNTIKLKDPHCLDSYRYAPIHYAAMNGHTNCVQLLLDHKCPVDLITHEGLTPLLLAVHNKDIVQLLVRYKADPNRCSFSRHETPLHIAACHGNIEIISILLSAGANIDQPNTVDVTPLMSALMNNRTEAAEMLIERGAKLNLQDRDGYTALYFAIITKSLSLTKLLLAKGARIILSHFLLHFCLRHDHHDIATELIRARCNVNVRDQSGWTPLFLAIKSGNVDMVEYLLSCGAQISHDDYILKEMHVAIQYIDNVEIFRSVLNILLSYGVEIDEQNCWDETPLFYSIMLEKYEHARCLVREGANVSRGKIGDPIDNLMLIRRTNNLNILKQIVYAGFNLHKNRPCNLKPPPWTTHNDDMEDWLAKMCNNPLSLQQMSRIVVRDLIRSNTGKVRNAQKLIEKRKCSNFQEKLLQLPLPPLVIDYLYDFTDVQLKMISE